MRELEYFAGPMSALGAIVVVPRIPILSASYDIEEPFCEYIIGAVE